MKSLLGAFAIMLLIGSQATGRKHKMKTKMAFRNNMFMADDALLEVEPIPPETMIGECSCECCEQTPEGNASSQTLVKIYVKVHLNFPAAGDNLIPEKVFKIQSFHGNLIQVTWKCLFS